jgi:hypothetical protein
MAEKRYWNIVASRDHVERGLSGGFIQANHGKAAPLKRMRPGDGVIFYSPKKTWDGSEKLQAFTAIAEVVGEEVYSVDMGDGFVPARRKVKFLPCREVSLAPLVQSLAFIRNKTNPGAIFRFGFFEIPPGDYEKIAGQMLPEPREAAEM